MRLKYQLRGLGIGIILTAALLMAFADDGKDSVKADDMEVLASIENETQESSMETESVSSVEETSVVVEEEFSTEENSLEMETTSEEESIVQTQMENELVIATTEESLEEKSVEEELSLEEDETKVLTDVVKIKVASGDDSGTVARKLQIAGLVDNASEFDAYLMQHGYDKKIAVGEKEIPMDATWIEIAEKISSR
ncbi:MAG: hypothetical protein IJN64_10515 [Lachnospiraceae bacterium]|nr:hypothetical protein [Lachnospiraceae bacterium]